MDSHYGCTVCPMDRGADNLADVQWVALCAERLREQWPRADRTGLEAGLKKIAKAKPPTKDRGAIAIEGERS